MKKFFKYLKRFIFAIIFIFTFIYIGANAFMEPYEPPTRSLLFDTRDRPERESIEKQFEVKFDSILKVNLYPNTFYIIEKKEVISRINRLFQISDVELIEYHHEIYEYEIDFSRYDYDVLRYHTASFVDIIKSKVSPEDEDKLNFIVLDNMFFVFLKGDDILDKPSRGFLFELYFQGGSTLWEFEFKDDFVDKLLIILSQEAQTKDIDLSKFLLIEFEDPSFARQCIEKIEFINPNSSENKEILFESEELSDDAIDYLKSDLKIKVLDGENFGVKNKPNLIIEFRDYSIGINDNLEIDYGFIDMKRQFPLYRTYCEFPPDFNDYLLELVESYFKMPAKEF